VSGQISQYQAMGSLNHLSGQAEILVQGTAPVWFPGVTWINSSAGYSINVWNGFTWVATFGQRYLALLTADPVAGGVVSLQDPGFLEVQTSGYARQPVTFTTASGTYPSTASNTGLITFGPMTATMVLPTQWVAMVTGSAGTTGIFLASWVIVQGVLVNASQSIQISPGQLVLDQA
jgi:hypothetical protein